MDWMDKKIQEGKIKIGICDYSKCEIQTIDTLYRVNDKFICGHCLDAIDAKMNLLGVK